MKEAVDEMCSAVGHLVLLATALDNQLNRITILLLGLNDATLLEPVVGSIDVARKTELIKIYVSKVEAPHWRKEIRKHAEAVEAVNQVRNIAAHSLLSFERGTAVLRPIGAAKLLKSIDLTKGKMGKTTLPDIQAGVAKAEATLRSGENVILNLERVAIERQRLSDLEKLYQRPDDQ